MLLVVVGVRKHHQQLLTVCSIEKAILCFIDCCLLKFSIDWGVVVPLDKEPVSKPLKQDEKRVGAPDEVKGKEIEILWPTEHEVQEGEFTKPQWERKHVNVRAFVN